MSKQFSLDHLASFSIEGPDARTYAQSQFTVSVDSLSDECWSPLAWCDPKGRVLAFMMARVSEDRVDLVLPDAQGESVRKRLERFTIGRRVQVSGMGPVAGSFHPDEQIPPLTLDRDRGMLAGAPAASDSEALQRWRHLDLCRGLPWLAPASSGLHLPQWLGLEALGALTYDKGCYPGQEVIARLHYRGSVKYRLAGLKLEVSAAFDPHTRITDRNNATVGRWLGGIRADEGHIGLAVLSTRIEEDEEVAIDHGDGAQTARVTAPEGLC